MDPLPLLTELPVGTMFGEEEMDAVRRVLFSGTSLNRGKDVDLFEQEFAAFVGAPFAAAVSSCSAALALVPQVLRLGKEDEVIVQPNAFWATVVPMVARGVQMKVADIHPRTLTIDPVSVERLITPKTKAIMVLSFGGNPCDMDTLRAIADKHGIMLVEDAAHASGAIYKGQRVGAQADITCFSFSTLKNMSTLGEGGMFVTRHETCISDAKKLREWWPIGAFHADPKTAIGQYPKPADPHFMRPGDAFDVTWDRLDEVGTNFKMSSICGAVGRVQLTKLDHHNGLRAAVARRYDAAIREMPGCELITVDTGNVHAYHLYNFFITEASGVNRDAFVAEMKHSHNIQLVNRFWPIHLHSIFRLNGHQPGEAPVYEKVWFTEQVALPIAPSMDDASVSRVIDAMKQSFAAVRG